MPINDNYAFTLHKARQRNHEISLIETNKEIKINCFGMTLNAEL